MGDILGLSVELQGHSLCLDLWYVGYLDKLLNF